MVIIWYLFEHISTLGSKTVGHREKVFSSYQATRELPFGDFVTAQWLTTRPAEACVYMYQTDPFFLLTY